MIQILKTQDANVSHYKMMQHLRPKIGIDGSKF